MAVRQEHDNFSEHDNEQFDPADVARYCLSHLQAFLAPCSATAVPVSSFVLSLPTHTGQSPLHDVCMTAGLMQAGRCTTCLRS
jgi:hypothetical protein